MFQRSEPSVVDWKKEENCLRDLRRKRETITSCLLGLHRYLEGLEHTLYDGVMVAAHILQLLWTLYELGRGLLLLDRVF